MTEKTAEPVGTIVSATQIAEGSISASQLFTDTINHGTSATVTASSLFLGREKANPSGLPHLTLLNHPAAKKMAEKIYITFIGEEDFAHLPAFMLQLDQLLRDYGGQPIPAEEEDETPPPEQRRAAAVESTKAPADGEVPEQASAKPLHGKQVEIARDAMLRRAAAKGASVLLRRI